MGREKRLSEAKTREMTDKTPRPIQPATAAAQGVPSMPTMATPGKGLTGGQIILQLILLYLLPISLIVLFGKLVLGI